MRTSSSNRLQKLPPQGVDELFAEQRFEHVLLLLENLVDREEATVKPILDCLYDVGSVNLIDQKCHLRLVNQTLKLIARMSKPLFRIMAWRWVKKNSPQLIANWLHKQVTFEKLAQLRPGVMIDNPPHTSESFESLALPASPNQEVKYLRSQVKLLIGILFAAIATFGGSLLWISSELERSHFQAIEQLKIQIEAQQTTANQP